MITQSVERAIAEGVVTGPILPHPLCAHCDTLLKQIAWPDDAGAKAIRTLGVTSSREGEGVSTVAAHLALAAARAANRSVLLVDANFACPSAHGTFGVPLQPGFAEWLQNAEELTVHAHTSGQARLAVVAAGKLSGRSFRAHDAVELASAMHELAADYDLIVFDMPPAGQTSFALRLAGLVDGVVFVVEAGRVHRDTARRTVELLRRANARLLGAVFNKDCQDV